MICFCRETCAIPPNNGLSLPPQLHEGVLYIPIPMVRRGAARRGVREYSCAALPPITIHVITSVVHVRSSERKYPFVILISKARCFISFSPETINFREHTTPPHTRSRRRTLARAHSTCTHRTPPPPSDPTTTETGRARAGDDDKTCFLEPSCSATPNASAPQCSWQCETLEAMSYGCYV